MKIPDYLTRYYQKGEYLFLSLNDLPLETANEVKRQHCRKTGIGGFYAQDDYLIHRREIEKWIYGELLRLGGKPENEVPVYMCLGDFFEGANDIRTELQKNPAVIRIPLRDLDLSAVSFTFPDSMVELVEDRKTGEVRGKRTNTPRVYMYEYLPSIIRKYKVFEHQRYNIEVQVWNREMLDEYRRKIDKGEIH
jgi:hypothetical protein